MSLGKKIKQLRKKNNITQLELAEKLNLAKSTISQYENDINIPSISILKKLSSLFDVSIDYLVENDNNLYARKKDKLLTTVAENPELYKSWQEISNRKKLQNLLQASKDLNPKLLDKLIEIIEILDTIENDDD